MSHDPLFDFIETHYPKNDAGVIPLHEPVLDGNEKKYLMDCIDTTFVSTVGAYVTEFEKYLKNITGAKHAIAMATGTSALHIAMIVTGVEEDTEVLTQPLTFIATCNAIKYVGADPVFIDVDDVSMGMCPLALQRFINEDAMQKEGGLYNKKTGKKISACLPMHVFGHGCQIDEIKKICDSYNIPLIEDAAEAIGSMYQGQHLGTFGIVGTLSFNGNKTITCGGGGALITNDDEIANKVRHLSTTARVQDAYEFTHDQVGYNYRLTNVNAAIGCAQLERLEEFVSIKRNMANKYAEFFDGLNQYQYMCEPSHADSNYWFNTVMLNNKTERDEFLNLANARNIQCRPVWKLMTDLPMFKNCQHDGIKQAINLYERLVNLPSSANAKI